MFCSFPLEVIVEILSFLHLRHVLQFKNKELFNCILHKRNIDKKRGAKIYAELVGGGMTADAHHITAPHPDGLGAKNVMKRAIEEAPIPNPSQTLTKIYRSVKPHIALSL